MQTTSISTKAAVKGHGMTFKVTQKPLLNQKLSALYHQKVQNTQGIVPNSQGIIPDIWDSAQGIASYTQGITAIGRFQNAKPRFILKQGHL